MPSYCIDIEQLPFCDGCSLKHKYCALRAAVDSVEKWYNCSITINTCNWRNNENENAKEKAQQTL